MGFLVKFSMARLGSILGVFFFLVSLIVAVTWKSLFGLVLRQSLRLEPSSVVYKMWEKNPLPIYLELYLFNLTNAEDILRNNSIKPNVQEIGPFWFEESREKVNVSWNDVEETITFNQTKKWLFIPERSENFYVSITNLNPIALTIAHISRLWKSQLHREMANALLNKNEPPLVTATAKEWLFDGIPDEFLKILEPLRRVSDIPIPYDKFGWFYQRNGSSSFDGVFTVKTGKSDIRDVGMLIEWNHMRKTEYYEDECADVYGSTGEVIPPLTSLQKTLSVFASDTCSYLTLKYLGKSRVEGIEGHEFGSDDSVFDNGTKYRENRCFYLGDSCPSGARNVSSCKFGSPVFISFPHFYLADPSYVRSLTGVKPSESKHKFSLKVEPKTGIPLSVDASFQINYRLHSYIWCDHFREVPEVYIPMIWFKQTARITTDYAVTLKSVIGAYNFGSYIFYAFCVVYLVYVLVRNLFFLTRLIV